MRRITALLLAVILLFSTAVAESRWVLCSDYVNIRRSPYKESMEVGRLDAGDEFETDGKIRNGFIRVLGVGEDDDGWIFAGYTSEDRPENVDGRYVCVAKVRAACRRWADGPRIKGKTGWIYNGTNVRVYWMAGTWSVTSRGYIKTEWLESDPE